MTIQTVKLYGHLAEQFGDELEIYGDTVARVLQIIEANFPGKFYNAIRDGDYFVWTDAPNGMKNGYATPEALTFSTSDETLRLMPRVEGASSKKGGIMAILGMVLVGVAIIASGGAASGLAGGLKAALAGGGLAGTAAQLGIGMALSGIGSMLVPMPDLDIDADPEDQHQSYILSGPINTMNEGGAIPVLYGAPIVGSTVISAGLEIEQIAIEADEETTPKDDDSDLLFTGADPNDPNQGGGGPGE